MQVGLLVHPEVSPALTLVLRDVFRAANRLLGEPRYEVELVSAEGLRSLEVDGAILKLARPRAAYTFLIVPPFAQFQGRLADWSAECRFLLKHQRRGTVLASACLGALMLATAGILDQRPATTHWRWSSFARLHFPEVKWEEAAMICDQGDVVTAGGYFAVIDLALHLVARSSSKDLAHQLGSVLLADSVRQKQSVYAQALVSDLSGNPAFTTLDAWIAERIHLSPMVEEMARHCHMSLRSFQRQFSQTYAMGPKKYLQLKRVEKAKALLADASLTMEAVLEGVGLSDLAAFRKIFQREIGLSPSEYRRKISSSHIPKETRAIR
jgi:transcriptional regulator GlxA family with amidase domain